MATSLTDFSATAGLAPRGMVWVAWRQRRSLILITLGLYTATAAVISVWSVLRARDLVSTGVTDLAQCSNPGMTTTVLASCERWLTAWDSWSTLDSQLTGVPAIICVLFGLGLGAAAVGHEFERGQGTFSFTQSISPMRWAATQLVTLTVPAVGGVLVLDSVITLLADHRFPATVSGTSFDPADLWLRPVVMVAMICLAFGLSILSRSSSGGFWGGLGFLVVGGMVLNFFSRSTGTSQSFSVACPNADGELCGRLSTVVFRSRALTTNPTGSFTSSWTVALAAVGLASLVGGFLLLRKRFR